MIETILKILPEISQHQSGPKSKPVANRIVTDIELLKIFHMNVKDNFFFRSDPYSAMGKNVYRSISFPIYMLLQIRVIVVTLQLYHRRLLQAALMYLILRCQLYNYHKHSLTNF